MDRSGIFAGDDPFAIARAWLAEAEPVEPNDPNAIYTDGYYIKTTLDPKLQTYARQALMQQIRKVEKSKILTEFKDRVGDIISGVVLSFTGRSCTSRPSGAANCSATRLGMWQM